MTLEFHYLSATDPEFHRVLFPAGSVSADLHSEECRFYTRHCTVTDVGKTICPPALSELSEAVKGVVS